MFCISIISLLTACDYSSSSTIFSSTYENPIVATSEKNNGDEDNMSDMTNIEKTSDSKFESSIENTQESKLETSKDRSYYFDMINSLPAAYDPYISEASPQSLEIYEGLYDEFDEFSHIQSKRSPGTIEFFVRTYKNNPAEGATIPNYDPFPEVELPYYSQWDQRWAYNEYAGGYFGQNGCGPTVLSMIYEKLSGDKSLSPDKMGEFAKTNGYAIKDNGTAWILFSEGAEKLGLTSEVLPLSENIIKNYVKAGIPIVLIVGPGHFTGGGHFIIIHGIKDGEFQVFDPFTISNCYRTFSYEFLEDQIRNIWAISK